MKTSDDIAGTTTGRQSRHRHVRSSRIRSRAHSHLEDQSPGRQHAARGTVNNMMNRETDGAMAYGAGFDNDDPAMDLAGELQEATAQNMVIDNHAFGEGRHGRWEVGDEVGRLFSDEDDNVVDTNAEATAHYSTDGDDDLSAEEAAMHVVDERWVSEGSDNDDYL